MTKMVMFCMLLVLVAIEGLSAGGMRRAVNWNGNNWGMSCDFKGNDLSSVRVRGEECSGRCAATAGCTHFAWTRWNGGTCWMKKGSISKANAVQNNDPTSACGVLDDGPVLSGASRYSLLIRLIFLSLDTS